MYAMRQARAQPQPAAGVEPGYYDPRFGTKALKVLPGEFVVARAELMLVTVLGSCVAACVRDPLAGVGGMNHFMLPESEFSAGVASARYGGYAMEMLINELLKHGAVRSRLEAKLFGGGNVLPGVSTVNIGARNAAFARSYLRSEHIVVRSEDLGGQAPRRVHYFPRDGRAFVRQLPVALRPGVVVDETRYIDRLRETPAAGSVELF